MIGNALIQAYLERALRNGCLHHTLLFSGLDGIGKGVCAKKVAEQLLECTERVRRENHPDLFVLRPEGKSGVHTIERLREIIDEVHKPPFEAKQKVFIIHDAERMLKEAANALLKTLEEPTLHCTLVLLSSSANEILPTILSRCQHLRFQPIPIGEIAVFLQEHYRVDEERAQRLAGRSQGSLGNALRILQNDKSQKIERLLVEALDGKMPSWQAVEQIEALFEDVEGIEFHRQVNDLLIVYLMHAREEEQKLMSGAVLRAALAKIAKAKLALERNIKLSACLHVLF